MNINERIKKIVYDLDITQSRFAQAIGVMPDLISRTVTERTIPLFEVVEKVYRAFPQLSPHFVLTGEGEVWQTPPQNPLFVNIAGPQPVAVRTYPMGETYVHEAQREYEPSPTRHLSQRIHDLELLLTAREEIITLLRKQLAACEQGK